MKRLLWLTSISVVLGLVIALAALTTPRQSQALGGDRVWKNYTHDKRVWALAADGNILWAGTWGGLLRWDLSHRSYTKYTPADGLAGVVVEDIAVDSQGRAWVGHDRGLSVCDDTGCTTYEPGNSDMPGDCVTEVAVAPDDRVWLHSRTVNCSLGEGVTVYNGSTWTTYDESNSDLHDDDVRSIAAGLDGHVWFGHLDGKASEFDAVSTWTEHTVDYSPNELYAATGDDAGGVWFITLSMVAMWNGTSWDRYYSPTYPYFQDIAVDGAGHPWIASLTGLHTFDGTDWTAYDTGNSGLLDDDMRAVAAQGQKLWVGYADSTVAWGLTQFDGSDWTHYETLDGLPQLTGTEGAAADEQGRVWFGASEGVASFDCMTWTKYDSSNTGGALVDTCYTRINADREGHVWFAGGQCAGGLVEFDGDETWTQHCGISAPNPLCWVEAVAVDEDNNVWVGSRYGSTTWRGLSMFDGSSWTTYDSSSSCMDSNVVSTLAIDGDGNKWLNCTTRFASPITCTEYGTVDLAIAAHYTDIVETVSEDPRCWVADPARNLIWVDRGSSGVSAFDCTTQTWNDYSRSDMGFTGLAGTAWKASLAGLDRTGDLWARVMYDLTEGGATRFDGSSWTAYRAADGVLEVPYDMAVDDYGRVWFTSQWGINMFYDPWQTTQVTLTADPPAGGRLTSIDCSTCVSVTADSVVSDTVVSYTPLAPSPTGSLEHIDHFFDLSAVVSGTSTPVTSFSPNYSVTVSYAGENTEAVLDDTLGLYWWDTSEWLLEPTSSVSTTIYRVNAAPNHMSHFAVLGEGSKYTYVPLVLKNY